MIKTKVNDHFRKRIKIQACLAFVIYIHEANWIKVINDFKLIEKLFIRTFFSKYHFRQIETRSTKKKLSNVNNTCFLFLLKSELVATNCLFIKLNRFASIYFCLKNGRTRTAQIMMINEIWDAKTNRKLANFAIHLVQRISIHVYGQWSIESAL